MRGEEMHQLTTCVHTTPRDPRSCSFPPASSFEHKYVETGLGFMVRDEREAVRGEVH